MFVVYLLGGLVIALGPGSCCCRSSPIPGRHLSYVLEIVAGVAMLSAAVFLWGHRDRLGQPRDEPKEMRPGRSSALLGATITAVELPTAFPYFAAIAAIVGADLDVVRMVMLLVCSTSASSCRCWRSSPR